MHTGSELIETWIPVGGFKVERRRLKTPEGGWTLADCLVPKWEIDELMSDCPCARQPALHRIVADCPPENPAVLELAGRYGLLTVSVSQSVAAGKPLPSTALPPEPVEVWKTEIRELRAATGLWDRILAGENGFRPLLEHRIATRLSRAPFQLAALNGNSGPFRLCYKPANLRAALWQRLAGETAGLLQCSRCPAPSCGRWFLRGDAARKDKQFCSVNCRNRAFRKQRRPGSLENVAARTPRKG